MKRLFFFAKIAHFFKRMRIFAGIYLDEMKIKRLFTFPILLLNALLCVAQTSIPTISPTATYTLSDGTQEESSNYSGNAPLWGKFEANAENADGYTATFEWRFTLTGETEPYLVRYEQDTEVEFTKAGTHTIVLYALFQQGNDTIRYEEDYWDATDPLRVTIAESKLDMPNAFSPNGDGINDIYRAKDSYQSLVSFHAAIYNRWGQKLYEWDDPAGGWDGTYKGKDVKQGVYYVQVKAEGADGVKYNIRRDVNLLRGYNQNTISE